MSKCFLLITANRNETNALLSDKQFFNYTSIKSKDPHDVTTYNTGKFGQYEVIHFELQDQGAVKSDASVLSVDAAIREFKPDAVILLGTAFGKDDEQTEEPRQHIGDVLVSNMIADYESGKIKSGKLQQNGARPESGRVLISAFREGEKDWHHICRGQKAKVYFGLILSGDKVVDDPDFKKALFKDHPRAIGGEMEGRGAYAACRRNELTEWIVIKAICDWGDGTKSEDKEQRQKDASESAVSILKHVFSKTDSFEKL
jgi:nucleoside phosphorylase